MRTKKPIPPNNIRALRTARGMSMDALGAKIGTDASTINKLEKGRTRLDAERLRLIAAALEVDPSAILEDGPEQAEPAPAARQEPARQPETPMLRIMGSAAGSVMQGTFQMTDGPVDYIEMPRALEHAKGIYALYVVGNSMEPMFRHGSICVVSEFRPPRVGDAVVIQEKRGENAPLQASIGILESRTNGKVMLRKLNPSAIIEFKSEYISTIHKVLDFNDLLGV